MEVLMQSSNATPKFLLLIFLSLIFMMIGCSIGFEESKKNVVTEEISTKPSNPKKSLKNAEVKSSTEEFSYPISTSTQSPYTMVVKPTATKFVSPSPIDPLSTNSDPAERTPVPLAELYIGYPFSIDYADYFNQINRPSDMVAVGMPGLSNLSALQTGKKVLMFGSVERFNEFPTEAIEQVDLVGLDLERGALTPEEQNDPVAVVIKASEIAKSRYVPLMVAPITRWSEEYGDQLAPFVDVFVLQMMRYQHDPQLFAEKVEEFTTKMRNANPNLTIFVQVGTQKEQSPLQLFDAIVAAQPFIDGVWIQWHYRPSGTGPKPGDPNIEDVIELINLLRP